MTKKKISVSSNQKEETKQTWICEEDFDGQLSIDVFQKGAELYVMSTIAGVRPEDVDIFVDNDLLTIRGKRHHGMEVNEKDFFYKECYWGGFSRSIILPTEVNVDKVKASLKNGVLTIKLPVAEKKKKISVSSKREE